MNFEYFTKTIQQRGKRYFQDNKVFSITGKNNHYHAIVLGKEAYSVDLTLDQNDHIVKASCNCPYASDGYHCKHEAALYYALEERLLENTQQYQDFKKIYRQIHRGSYNDYICHNRFMKEIKSYIKTLTQLEKKNQLDITFMQRTINDLISINYIKGYRQELMKFVFDNYIKLMINTDLSITVDWLSQIYVNGKNDEYDTYFQKVLQKLSIENQDQFYQKTLSKVKYNVDLFLEYVDFLKENHMDVANKIMHFEKYKNNSQYIYYHFVYLIQNDQREEAIKEYQQSKLKGSIDYQLKSLLYEDQRDSYYQYMKKQLQFHYDNVMETCSELKYFYEDWDNYKYDFYSYVRTGLNSFDYKRVLKDQKEKDLMMDELLNHPDIYMFNSFKEHIDDQELKLFLNMICLLEEAENVKNASAYLDFEYNLKQLFNDVQDRIACEEIVSLFKEAYPKRKRLHEILDNLLDGGQDDGIQY